ncbi:MAG: hypothetical protein HUU09_06995 [Candidatus Jettenia caeni]|nr:hypothetical protein [Candidatus Jettenia caeni]UJS18974.1 MAG: hypothetical protein L3J17_07955 [Candidatus Jettenia sp.]
MKIRTTEGKTEEAERAGSKEERERGGTYEMGERGQIKEEGKIREEKSGEKKEESKAKEKEEVISERKTSIIILPPGLLTRSYSTSRMKPNISSTEERLPHQSLRGSYPKQSLLKLVKDCFGKNPRNDTLRDSVTFPIPAYNQRLMRHILFGFISWMLYFISLSPFFPSNPEGISRL